MTDITPDFTMIEGRDHPDRVRIVTEVVASVAPMHAAVAGLDVLEQLAHGDTFESLEGGRQLDILPTIGHLADITALAQVTFLVVAWVRARRPATAPRPDPVALADEVEATVRARMAQLLGESTALSDAAMVRQVVERVIEKSQLID